MIFKHFKFNMLHVSDQTGNKYSVKTIADSFGAQGFYNKGRATLLDHEKKEAYIYVDNDFFNDEDLFSKIITFTDIAWMEKLSRIPALKTEKFHLELDMSSDPKFIPDISFASRVKVLGEPALNLVKLYHKKIQRKIINPYSFVDTSALAVGTVPKLFSNKIKQGISSLPI